MRNQGSSKVHDEVMGATTNNYSTLLGIGSLCILLLTCIKLEKPTDLLLV